MTRAGSGAGASVTSHRSLLRRPAVTAQAAERPPPSHRSALP